jgi:hypothetical protein
MNMSKKSKKIEELHVENTDLSMTDGRYDKSYWGKVVTGTGGISNYFSVDGSQCCWLAPELRDILLERSVPILEVVEASSAVAQPEPVAASPVSVSLIDMIGDKPKSVNIEF